MSDSPIVAIFLCFVVAVAVGFLAYEDGRKSVARDCESLNNFRISATVYRCSPANQKATP